MYPFHNNGFVLNIRILVIRVCFVFVAFALRTFRASCFYFCINFLRQSHRSLTPAKRDRLGPEDQVFKDRINRVEFTGDRAVKKRITMKKTGWIILILLWATVAAAAEITIVTEILPPWQTTDGKDVGGIATEVVEATLREADVEGRPRAYPWARAYRMAQQKPNVLIYSMVRTPERENLFKWVGVIGSVREHFFKMADREDIRLTTINDAKKCLTTIPRADFRHDFLVNRGFKTPGAFHLVNSQDQALRMLYAGRTDLVMDDELTLAYELRHLKLDPGKIETALYVPEMSVDFEMAFSKQTPDRLVKQLQSALEAIKAKGIYHNIIKWHEMPEQLTK